MNCGRQPPKKASAIASQPSQLGAPRSGSPCSAVQIAFAWTSGPDISRVRDVGVGWTSLTEPHAVVVGHPPDADAPQHQRGADTAGQVTDQAGQVAGQALYLDDIFSFFEIKPEIASPPNALAFPKPIAQGFAFEDVAAELAPALTGALRQLFAVVENYPQLKANENVMRLQEELTGTENRIAFARQFYNDSVMRFNTRLQTFPTNVIAGMLGFTAREFFETDDAEREPVKVDLR